MNYRKSVDPLLLSLFKISSHTIKILPLLILLVMLLNPFAALRSMASTSPQPASRLTSQAIENLPHPLDIESRLVCRQAVEQVYWQHRIWPAENPEPKPDLEQVLPAQVLRAKVEDELRRSNALAEIWQRPITGGQLQAEIERMTRDTRQPQVLAEIFAALGNDPYLVAECLARPVLTERLVHNWYAAEPRSEQDFERWWQDESRNFSTNIDAPDYDYKLVAPARIAAQDDTWTPTPALPEGVFGSTAVWTGSEVIIWGGVGAGSGGRTNNGSRYNPATDTWMTVAAIGAASPRMLHTAVWTGSQMIVWGGCDQSSEFCDVSSGGLYDPLTDSWTSTSLTGVAAARMNHTAVWTGSEMIVWGGCSVGPQGNNFCNIQRNDGGVYDPATDSWQSMSTAGAPDARERHKAVWANDVMVIWGGYNIDVTNTGGRYDPVSNTWQTTSTAGAPEARANHTMVWTGSEAIVWGGCDMSSCLSGDTYFDTGGRYNPVTNDWTPTDTSGVPQARSNHTAVWTGTEMIVWGGRTSSLPYLDTGSRYDPDTDTWVATGAADAPAAKSSHLAVWTGTEMIVWGGGSEPGMSRTGGRYDPGSDSWVPTSTNDPVYAKERHTAVWTGTEMLVWGGSTLGYGEFFGFGIRFDAVTGNWSLMSTIDEPSGRYFHTAVWTGSEMIVWGGHYGNPLDSGGRYDPITDSWTETSLIGSPVERTYHAAVWTGSEMIVWGGTTYSDVFSNSGNRYNPDTDTWSAVSMNGAPSQRSYLRGVWSGSEMIIWGGVTETGDTNTGGRYDPLSNSWNATSTTNAPIGRHFNTAIWTGSEMIVWGGMSGNLDNGVWYNTGGRYDPISNTWSTTSMTDVPSPRIWHVDAWTGQELIVWGGCTGNTNCPDEVYTGGRYDLISDSWMETSIQSAPSERSNASAVWTGAEMLVWGGLAGNVGTYTSTGGFYHASTIPNTPPEAFPDSYSTDEDVELNVIAPGVLENDIDEDGNPLSALLVSNPLYGTLNFNSDGSFTYTPDQDFNGNDSFNYRATDGIALSNIAAVTITVEPVNDAPVAEPDSYSLDENTSLVIDPPGILGNDDDVDGDLLSAILESGPSHGTLALNSDGSFTYTPDQDFSGSDSFSYRAFDGIALSNIAAVTITVEPVNEPPVAEPDSYSLDEDTSLVIDPPGILGNDDDADGDILSAVLESGPLHGTLVLNSDGSFTYTPDQDFYGSDSFNYRAFDGLALSEMAVVDLTVNPVNDAPIAVDDLANTLEDTPVSIAVLENDSDIDGPGLSISALGTPNLGTAVISGTFVLYTPSVNLYGSDSFTYTVSDGSLQASALVTVEITPVNDAPLAVDDAYTIAQDHALVVLVPGVLANDSDVDGDSLTAVLSEQPQHGSLVLEADGSFIYTPAAGFSGADHFIYQASDGSALSAEAVVYITIQTAPPPGTEQISYLPIITR
jgi:VCBS repeat-containing protein